MSVHSRFAVFVSLFLAVTLSQAQDIPIPMPQMDKKAETAGLLVIEPAMNAFFAKGGRSGMFVSAFVMNPVLAEGFQGELGLSGEQVQAIKADFMQSAESLGPGMATALGRLEGLSDEELDAFVLTEEEARALDGALDGLFDAMDQAGLNHLTDEQRAKMEEMTFVMLGGIDSPFLDLTKTSALDLSDEQKKRFAEQADEMAAERKELLAEISAFAKKVVKERKMNLKETKAYAERIEALTLKHKQRVADILTEEQLAEARRRMKKVPKFLTKISGMPDLSQWMPGLGSWKPGDPVPETDDTQKSKPRDPKRRGFPRKAEPETAETP